MNRKRAQQSLCSQYGSAFVPPGADSKVGIALASLTKAPLNACVTLRREYPRLVYLAGKSLSQSPQFFQPLHVRLLAEYCPSLLPDLGLAPGWRVLAAGDQVDVWHDPELLEIPLR